MKRGYKPTGKLGSGSRFNSVSNQVKAEYLKKGYSAAKAQAIGGAVAAKAGKKKFGSQAMKSMAKVGK